jgi:hypothetical protein
MATPPVDGEDGNGCSPPDADESAPTTGPLGEDADFHHYRTWIDHVVGDTSAGEVGLRALGFSVGIFGLGFVVAVAGGSGTAYLQSPSAYLVAVGMLFISLSYAWGSRRFLSLWPRIRNAFATSDDVYESHVQRGLNRVYDDRTILAEFGLAAVAVLSLQFVVPIPAAVHVGLAPVTEVMGVTVRYTDVINHLFGIVALLFAVTGLHMAVTGLYLLHRVTLLPLVSPRTAATELEAFGAFSAIAASIWFLLVVLIVVVYQSLFEYLLEIGEAFGHTFWVLGTVAVILLVGIAIFAVPQVAIHSALVRRKRERLRELDEELDAFMESLRAGDREPDELSMALELHDRKRERVAGARTWLYDGRRLLHLAVSGITATVSLVGSVLDLPGIGL